MWRLLCTTGVGLPGSVKLGGRPTSAPNYYVVQYQISEACHHHRSPREASSRHRSLGFSATRPDGPDRAFKPVNCFSHRWTPIIVITNSSSHGRRVAGKAAAGRDYQIRQPRQPAAPDQASHHILVYASALYVPPPGDPAQLTRQDRRILGGEADPGQEPSQCRRRVSELYDHVDGQTRAGMCHSVPRPLRFRPAG